MRTRRRSPGPVPQQQAPVQAEEASTFWGMPWMRVSLALVVSVLLQVAVYVYIKTYTSDIETKLKDMFNSEHPQYNKTLEMADTVRDNHDFVFISSMVIQIVCFGPLIVVFFLESAVMCGLRMLWWLVFNRYTIGCAFFAAIPAAIAYFFF